MDRHIAYIGIGSNLGNASQHVLQAIHHLAHLPDTCLDQISSCYRTAPVEAAGNDYINAVARLFTGLDPEPLLEALFNIEDLFGRQRPYRNAPRTLDLDLLLYDSELIRTAQLAVPHPRMTKRAFVLVPLAEIAPDLVIPGEKPLSVLLDCVKDQRVERC